MRKSARALAKLGMTIDVVLTSPLVRTRQTAEIVASAFDPRPAIVNVEALAPGGNQANVLAELEKHVRRGHIAIVGHEPGIGELAGRLSGMRHALELKKGAVAKVEMTGRRGSLHWLVTPKIARALQASRKVSSLPKTSRK